MRYIILLVISYLLVSCSTVRVNYDYDRDTDFSNYGTYNYHPHMRTGLTELDERRLLNMMDITLQIKGMVYSEEPDFLIDITSEYFRDPQKTAVGVGLGGTGGNVGGGVSIGIPVGQKSLQRQIHFKFVDTERGQLFWEGVGQSSFKENVTPVEREQKLMELVDKVLSKYPPKAKK